MKRQRLVKSAAGVVAVLSAIGLDSAKIVRSRLLTSVTRLTASLGESRIRLCVQ